MGKEDAARLIEALKGRGWLEPELGRNRKQIRVPILKQRPRLLAVSTVVMVKRPSASATAF
jgi:hypothetical protein